MFTILNLNETNHFAVQYVYQFFGFYLMTYLTAVLDAFYLALVITTHCEDLRSLLDLVLFVQFLVVSLNLCLIGCELTTALDFLTTVAHKELLLRWHHHVCQGNGVVGMPVLVCVACCMCCLPPQPTCSARNSSAWHRPVWFDAARLVLILLVDPGTVPDRPKQFNMDMVMSLGHLGCVLLRLGLLCYYGSKLTYQYKPRNIRGSDLPKRCLNRARVYRPPAITPLIATKIQDKDLRQSVEVGNAAFSSDWYNSSTTFKKSLMMMIMRAQKPVVLTAGRFGVLSLESFTGILQKAYSYFAVLREVVGE
uniref:Odorant receptor n=1 Tax=Timema bartmani TaxID=61472 RepID=A0A7R9F9Y7_9NEOP|nr:unnamed protein product [Timema bartmani]